MDTIAAMTATDDRRDAFSALLQRHRGIVFKVANTYARLAEDRDERGVNQAIIAAVEEIGRSEALADVLVFLPGEKQILETRDLLVRSRVDWDVLPLYGRLTGARLAPALSRRSPAT